MSCSVEHREKYHGTTVLIFGPNRRRAFVSVADTVVTFWIRAEAVTGLVAIAVQELVEFSLQMPGKSARCCMLTAIAVHRPARTPAELTQRSRRYRAAVS
jgi:hypothetical protein